MSTYATATSTEICIKRNVKGEDEDELKEKHWDSNDLLSYISALISEETRCIANVDSMMAVDSPAVLRHGDANDATLWTWNLHSRLFYAFSLTFSHYKY